MGLEDLPIFQKGAAKIPAADLNKLVTVALRQVTGGNGINVRRFGDRLVIETAGPTTPGKATDTRLFSVVEEFDDYLECVPYVPGTGPNMDAPTVNVAKPPLLQRRNWDGRTIVYDDESTVEYDQVETGQRNFSTTTPDVTTPVTGVQAIEPPYFGIQEDGTGDIITAVAQTAGFNDADDVPIAWVDTNTGARAWLIPSAAGAAIWQLGLIDSTSAAGVAAGGTYLLNYYNTKKITDVNGKPAAGQALAFAANPASSLFWNGELVGWTTLASGQIQIQKLWNTGITVSNTDVCCRPCVAWGFYFFFPNASFPAPSFQTPLFGPLTPNTGTSVLRPIVPPQLADFCIPYDTAVAASKTVTSSGELFIFSVQSGVSWVATIGLGQMAAHIANGVTKQPLSSYGVNLAALQTITPSSILVPAGSGIVPTNAVPTGNGVVAYNAIMYWAQA